MSFQNLSLVKKLGVGFGIVLFIVAVSSCFVWMQTRNLIETVRLNSVSDDAVDLVDQLLTDAYDARASAYKFVISGDKADLPKYEDAKKELQKDFAAVADDVGKDAPQFLDHVANAKSVIAQQYIEAFLDPQIRLAADPATRQQAFASIVSGPSVDARKAFEATLASLREEISKWSDHVTAEANASMSLTLWIVGLSGAVSLAMGLSMAWFLARSIGGPLVRMTATMRSLANGDNNVDVPGRDQTDEIGQMAAAFKDAAVEKLRLEDEAVQGRHAAQAARERGEAERALAAQQQSQVVENIASGLAKLAGGDLLQQIDQPFAADYESLRGDFNAAVIQLQKTIKEVLTSTGTIRSGTGEIATASDELSRRTEQQAANLEETAAALAEISSAMKRTAEGASHARQVVGVAQSTADHSNEVIIQTISAMGSIEHASRQISQIISVIDEIAFQTNLLALNAGVEAARAGEAGRGFAVVASEVRALAQRCAEAAKEVKGLVMSSEQHVKVGVDLVGESGKMLSQIVEQVAELKTIVNDIAGSAEQQAAGLSEVNVAVMQLDQVTQQNAAMAEEATAAAHHLAKEGSELVRLVGRFNVGSAAEANGAPLRAAGGADAHPLRAVRTPPPARRSPMKKAVNGNPGAAAVVDSWEEF